MPQICQDNNRANPNDNTHYDGISPSTGLYHRYQAINARHGSYEQYKLGRYKSRKRFDSPMTCAMRVLILSNEARCLENSDRVS